MKIIRFGSGIEYDFWKRPAMRFKFLAVATLVIGLTLGASAQAEAVGSPTVTTFTLTGGVLAITPTTAAVLSGSAPGAASVSGSLGLVTVADARGVTTPWVASVSSTTFTGPGPTVSTGISYNAGAITIVLGVPTIPASVATTLTTTAASVVAPTSISGINTVAWNPVLTVSLPSTALAGLYTGTLTTSVA
jgi:hypothetical protein